MKQKKLILIASPPACGKTTLAKRLAAALGNVVYLDKDALNPFGRQLCRVAGEDYNPDSAFYVREVRDIEYEVTMTLGLEALAFADTVIINAPLSREIRDAVYMRALRERVAALGGEVVVVYIMATPALCRARMAKRAHVRDTWKLENWETYIESIRFEAPDVPKDAARLYLYHNETEALAAESFAGLLDLLLA